MTRRAEDIEVRPITEPEIREWNRALNTGFLRPPDLSDHDVADLGTYLIPSRTLAAFDPHSPLRSSGGAPVVATFRSFPQELTAVGGAPVPADAITNVSVTATHRRRGILSRMMALDLAAAKERGDVVATLIAAEYPIYGRYGFGPATHSAEWTIDVPRTGLDRHRPTPDDGGRIDLVDGSDVRKLGPELHERLRRTRPGVINRSERWWQVTTGAIRLDARPWTQPFLAVYRSPSGEVEGLAAYVCDDHWGDDKRPLNTASVKNLITTSPAAERALWHYLCSIDWVTTVKSGRRAPDDLLPHLLPDPRAARLTTYADWLWVRILDVVRALEARTYGGSGTLVLEVVDEAGLTGGRYRLEAGPDGAKCAPTDLEPQLILPVAELATLWLGDESAVRLAALGRVREQQEGAAHVADALLRTSRRPWCPDIF
ncbi:GNAT family N-acetyltransferase [Streptomyces chiangmaiensis]|uniref:GNAT family N-acetyltransferase n=1 Tax=Streptomyces chiangmaiensis TaxID=766497 RepID=A0ABU7FEU6_9ACTN|nr:GNAT family N-acetyltransferase [Streptomyces chiangmaiensis]MED7822496.1 GNAT family N-acetyltransferase [Streptomyces chiangmaiensis]